MKGKFNQICECVCGCTRISYEGEVCSVCNPPKPPPKRIISEDIRIDIKALLRDPIKKAKLIANAVRTSRFFK